MEGPRTRRRDRHRRARSGGAEPRHAARGAALRHHADRSALSPDPLRHPRRRPGIVPIDDRWARRTSAHTDARGASRPALGHRRRDARVCGQRTGAPGTARDQPALAARRGRNRGVDRDTARAATGGVATPGERRRRRVRRAGSRHRGRRRAGLRARALAHRGEQTGSVPRLRDERPAAAAAAWLPASPDRPGLVRDGAREVAHPHPGARERVRRLSERHQLPPPRQRGGPRDTDRTDPGAQPDGASRILHVPAANTRPRRGVRCSCRVARGPARRRSPASRSAPTAARPGPMPRSGRSPRHTPGARGPSPGKPSPGRHTVCSRATDADGATQPDAPAWNLGGYLNNAVERIEVEVRSA